MAVYTHDWINLASLFAKKTRRFFLTPQCTLSSSQFLKCFHFYITLFLHQSSVTQWIVYLVIRARWSPSLILFVSVVFSQQWCSAPPIMAPAWSWCSNKLQRMICCTCPEERWVCDGLWVSHTFIRYSGTLLCPEKYPVGRSFLLEGFIPTAPWPLVSRNCVDVLKSKTEKIVGFFFPENLNFVEYVNGVNVSNLGTANKLKILIRTLLQIFPIFSAQTIDKVVSVKSEDILFPILATWVANFSFLTRNIFCNRRHSPKSQ